MSKDIFDVILKEQELKREREKWSEDDKKIRIKYLDRVYQKALKILAKIHPQEFKKIKLGIMQNEKRKTK